MWDYGASAEDTLTDAEHAAMLADSETERDASIEAEGPAWPDDQTLEDWAQPSEPGVVWYVDDPWTETAPPVLWGMTVGEWMVWMPEIGRILDAAIDDMHQAALAALEG